MFKFKELHLVYSLILFNTFYFYYVKNKGKKYWYKNEIPLFRIHCFKL